MPAEEAKVINKPEVVFVSLPMTKPTGKVRIKRRSFFADYGEPVAPRQIALSQSNYVEWQIGYDLLACPENAVKTSLSDHIFSNYKKEKKYAYELSEIAYYAFLHGFICLSDIQECYDLIKNIPSEDTFEETASISRTNPRKRMINGLSFYEMNVSYPLFVHRFGQYEIFAEIMIREKQKAVGTQAMLYVCLPLTTVRFARDPFGRTLDSKECAQWRIGKEEAELALELFRVFGMLSAKHRHDVMEILKMLFPAIQT